MTEGFTEPARRPPDGLAGLDPTWSKLVHVPKTDAFGRTWHLLDNGVTAARVTLLCVHGNPAWSYLWRGLVAQAPDDVRVIAVDQLNMGFSERTGQFRRLTTRIDDLTQLTDQLGLDGPVTTVAHDWGGPVSLGWAQRHQEQLAGVVLLNTAVHQPAGSSAPTLIRLVRTRGVLQMATVDTGAFIAGAAELSRPRLSADVRRGLRAPYDSAERREAIAHFVEDIPLDPDHPSAKALDAVAAGLEQLGDVPALLLWGPRDKVFSDLYLRDLEKRLPQADVHRFAGASHFVSEDADTTGAILDWLKPSVHQNPLPTETRQSLWGAIAGHPDPAQPAVIEMAPSEPSISFEFLAKRVEATAAGLVASGVAPGDRVALMIPPNIDLTVALYSLWRMGAVPVLIDAGLGPKGMSRALASAAPDHFVGITKALVAAKSLRWPGQRFSVAPLTSRQNFLLGVAGDLESLALTDASPPSPPAADALAAIAFTSGATGPSKGVLYRHRQVQAQRDALMARYGITSEDRLVAAFALFALYGPTMGITSVVPDMDVTAPGTLTASALGDAVVAVDATLVFASPAALVNVVKTAGSLTEAHREAFKNVRLLLSAGAPVRPALLRAANDLFPNAEAHTPYGMTEVLPVADIGIGEIESAGAGDGVCVGLPLGDVEVRISALNDFGEAVGELSEESGLVGEIVVRAAHVREGYHRLWHTQYKASQPPGWHRTGDVGSLDSAGRLWVGGRIGHVISAPSGPVMPVGIEQAIEDLDDVELAAVVGVGPTGTQQIVAVVEQGESSRRPRLGDLDLHDRVRAQAGHDVVAVLVVPRLPVDRRHNSKIDRTRVANWATGVLAGGRIGRL